MDGDQTTSLSQTKSRRCAYLLCVAGFIVGVASGLLFSHVGMQGIGRLNKSPDIRRPMSAYRLINPLLDCDLGQEYFSNSVLRPSVTALEDKIEAWREAGVIKDISVYYRDLNNGPWVGINEKKEFLPASLFKVPIMMYYYRLAESDPSILQRRIVLQEPQITMDQYFKPSRTLEANEAYSIETLIEHMIKYSDNQAMMTLLGETEESPVEKIFHDLSIEYIESESQTISVRDYAMLFRVLFNASYLNAEFSEKALRLLTQSDFTAGLRSGVPLTDIVAHKFGEREWDNERLNQVHDCGIVYKLHKPYILCVMTRGYNPDRLAAVIGEISKDVYESVSD